MLEQDMIVDEQQEGPERFQEFSFGKEWGDFQFLRQGKKETVLRCKGGMTFYFSHEVAS